MQCLCHGIKYLCKDKLPYEADKDTSDKIRHKKDTSQNISATDLLCYKHSQSECQSIHNDYTQCSEYQRVQKGSSKFLAFGKYRYIVL